MRTKYLFTVVMAVYNVEKYLAEALESIVTQSVDFAENVQIVLVDDGSSDGSGEICDVYRERYPDNIEVIHQENAGVAAARNAGMARIRGDYVCFMDSDDKLTAGTFKAALNFFSRNEKVIDLLAIPMTFFEGASGDHILNIKFAKGDRIIDLDGEWNMPQLSMSSAFVSAKALEGVTFDTRLKHLEDMKVVQQILLRKRKYGVICGGRYLYRRRSEGAKSAVQSASSRPNWYSPTLRHAAMELFDLCVDRCGYVPKFVQFTVMYDIQWRLTQESIPDGVLSDAQLSEYKDLLHQVLSRVDDDVIYAQRNMFAEHKQLAMAIKYGKDMQMEVRDNDVVFHFGSMVVSKLSQCRFRLEFLYVREGSMIVDARVSLPHVLGDEISFMAMVGTEEFEEAPLDRKPLVMSMGQPIIDMYRFRISIPLEKVTGEWNSIRFYSVYRGARIRFWNHTFGRFFPIGIAYRNAYWKSGDVALRFRYDALEVRRCTKAEIGKMERDYCRELWRLNKLGARKAVLARKLIPILRHFKRKPLFLVSDRISAARDNGEAFFRYMREKHPEIDTRFVVAKSSPAYRRLGQVGPVLSYGSFKYKLMSLISDVLVSSQAEEQVYNPFYGYSEPYRDLLAMRKYVFLGHGITQNDVSSWLNRYKKNISGIVTASRREYDSFLNYGYEYPEHCIWLTGLPRYDRLYRDERKLIVIMPSWRRNLVVAYDAKKGVWPLKKEFCASSYFCFYNALLNDQRLVAAAKRLGYTLAFFPHPNMIQALPCFTRNGDVDFLDPDMEYRDVMARADLMVTDYSSVAFDFAYLRKPIVYSQFDYDEFYATSAVIRQGYFNYERDGFGEVERDLDGLVARMVEYMESGCTLKEKYRERINDFFAFEDQGNSERVYQKIMEDSNIGGVVG